MKRLRLIDPVEETIKIKRERMINTVEIVDDAIMADGANIATVRRDGDFRGTIWLNPNYDWEIGNDAVGQGCLIPLRVPVPEKK